MRRLSCALFLVAICAAAPAIAAPPSAATDPLAALEAQQEALFAGVAPSVVYISNGKGSGTGFFVSKDGLILTNAHVVGKSKKVKVITHDGKKHTGEVVERGKGEVDLALVRIARKGTPPLELATLEELRVGSWVGSVGHGWGGIWAYTTGMISNIYPSGDSRPVFQTQIPLNPGNSGGPIFDREGRVVGIVTWGIEQANNMNFAITAEVAMAELEGLGDQCDCLVVEAPAGLPIFVGGKMVGKGPRLVVSVEKGPYEVFVVRDGKMDKRKIRWPEQRRVDFRTSPPSASAAGD